MFPNVRLLIAAIIASVVTLTCGFGIFAAFRVNHEPLARLPAGAAPLRFAADQTAALSVAATEAFDHRFPAVEATSNGGATTLAPAAAEPPEQAATKSEPSAEGPAPGAPLELAAPLEGQASASEEVLPDSVVTVGKTSPDVRAQASEPAPISGPTVTVIEPSTAPGGPSAPAPVRAAVAPAEAVSADTASESTAKKRARLAKRPYGSATASAAFNPYAQNWSYLQPHFLTAPPPYPPPQPVMIRRHRVASEKPAHEKPANERPAKQKPANTTSAIGGPLVSPAHQ